MNQISLPENLPCPARCSRVAFCSSSFRADAASKPSMRGSEDKIGREQELYRITLQLYPLPPPKMQLSCSIHRKPSWSEAQREVKSAQDSTLVSIAIDKRRSAPARFHWLRSSCSWIHRIDLVLFQLCLETRHDATRQVHQVRNWFTPLAKFCGSSSTLTFPALSLCILHNLISNSC